LLFVAAQHQRDLAANRSKMIAFENPWKPGGNAPGRQGSRRADG
jgi:hypothetical protein